MSGLALELSGISKRFGGTVALDGAELSVSPGEIHALLGENGAGKSTLVAIAAGRLAADAGSIARDGRPLRLASPRDARAAGIALVPQHDLLVEAMSVADNLALLDPTAPLLESARARRARVEDARARFGLDVGPADALVAELPVGTRQRIEITAALLTDPAVLVLDEPTAVLSPDETAALFAALRARVASGRAVVVITHRLGEVFEGADRLTLLARGRTVLETRIAETTPERVAELLLAGAEVPEEAARKAAELVAASLDQPVPGLSPAQAEPPGPCRDVALRVDRLRPAESRAEPVSFALAAGELLVLLAIDGNGADALAGAVAGVAPAEGVLTVAGRDVRTGSPRAFRAAGGGFIPADRRAEGLVPELTLAENLALGKTRGLFLDRRRLRDDAARSLRAFGVRASGPLAAARELSGGNQQKLLLARELDPPPRVLVAIHPTRGLDLGAAAEVLRRLAEARRSGCALLVVTADPDEARALGGTLRVVYRGRLSEPLPASTPLAALGRRMAGLAA